MSEKDSNDLQFFKPNLKPSTQPQNNQFFSSANKVIPYSQSKIEQQMSEAQSKNEEEKGSVDHYVHENSSQKFIVQETRNDSESKRNLIHPNNERTIFVRPKAQKQYDFQKQQTPPKRKIPPMLPENSKKQQQKNQVRSQNESPPKKQMSQNANAHQNIVYHQVQYLDEASNHHEQTFRKNIGMNETAQKMLPSEQGKTNNEKQDPELQPIDLGLNEFQEKGNTQEIRIQREDQNNNRDNQESCPQKVQKWFINNPKKGVGLIALFLTFLSVLAVLIVAAKKCWFQNSLCPTIDTVQFTKPVYMVDPDKRFKINQCTKYNYTVSNEMQSRKFKEQYVTVFCVKNVTKEQIFFVSSIQKSREESSDNDKPVVYDTYYEQYFFKENPNLNSEDTNVTDDQEIPSTIETSSLDSSEGSSVNSSYQTPNNQDNTNYSASFEFTHPIYRFSIHKNGTIMWLSFPKKGDKHVRTLLKAFIQAFAPLIDASLYESQNNQTLLRNHKRLLQLMEETNGNNENSVIYNSTTSPDNTVVLQTSEISMISNQGQHTEATASRNFSHAENGTMTESNAQAQTSFISESTEQSEDYQVTNMNQLNFKADQQISLKYVFTKETKDENLQAILDLASHNETLNFTLELFEQYLSKPDDSETENGTVYDEQPANNLTRLLYEAEDGSISLKKLISKEYYIIKVKPIGIEVSYKVFTDIGLRMRTDPNDQINKIPYFNLEIGSLLIVGPILKQKMIFVKQEKQLPPLSLRYTLKQVEQVISYLKPSFITSITDVFGSVLDGDISSLLSFKSSYMNTYLDKLLAEILKEYDLMDPYNVIKKVINLVKQVKSGIEDKSVNNIINIKKPIVSDLLTEITNYCEANFPGAVAAFQNFKNGVDTYKNQSVSILNASQVLFGNDKPNYLTIARSLISQQQEDLFNQEMKKAEPIVENLKYIQSGIKNYSSMFVSEYENHKNVLFTEMQSILGFYLNKTQTNLTFLFVTKVQQIQNIFTTELKNLSTPFEHFLQSVDQSVLARYQIIAKSLELTATDWKTFFTDYFVNLEPIAYAASDYAVGSCCDRDWLGRCKYRNPGEFQTRAEFNIFKAFRTSAETSINGVINVTSLFISQINTTFNNKSMLVREKIDKFKQLSQALTGTDLAMVKEQLNSRIQNAWYLISIRCGIPGWPLDNYVNALQTLMGKLSEFQTAVNTLTSRVDLFNVDFTVEDYQKLQSLISYSEQTTALNQTMLGFIKDSYESYKNFTNFKKNYTIDQFLTPQKLFIESYDSLYQIINDKIDLFCTTEKEIMGNVTKIKENIQKKIDQSASLKTNLSSRPYVNAITQVNSKLQQVLTIIFQSFTKIPFCTYSNNLITLVNKTSTPLIYEFRELQFQYVDFNTIWTSSINNFTSMIDKTKTMVSGFYILRNILQYEKYVKKAKNYTQEVKELFMKCTRGMAAIREGVSQKIKAMNYTQYFAQSGLETLIKPFRELMFVKHYETVFSEAQGKYQKSMEIIFSLSFDIIELVVAGKVIKQEIEQTISDFESGISTFKTNITELFDLLGGLTDRFTADQLEAINSRLSNIGILLGTTVYPHLESIIPDTLNDFRTNIYIQRDDYLKLYKTNLDKFQGYASYLISSKNDLLNKIKNVTDFVKKTLNSLKLADYTKISQLGKDLLKDFTNFETGFIKEVNNLFTLEGIIGGNFEKLFTVNTIINRTFTNIKNQYQTMTQSINQKVTTTLTSLNQSFLTEFSSTSIHSTLSTLNTSLPVDFGPIKKLVDWTVDRIEFEFSVLTDEFKAKLLQLSKLRQDFKYMKQAVEKRISLINQNIKNATKSFTNIKNLLFTVLKEDIDQFVMKQLNSVFVEVDRLVEQDLKNISTYAKQSLPQSLVFLTSSFDQVFEVYGNIKTERISIQDKIIATIERLQQAVSSKVFDKFSNLKQGQHYLKGKLDDFIDEGSVILYQQDLYNRSVPIIVVVIPIPVIIGVFYVNFGLNYTLGVAFAIGITNYRDVDANVTFGAGLVVQASFSWGIKYIIEIGVFVRGPILRAEIKPRILIEGIVPIQLVKLIANVPQITNKNAVKVYGQLYFGIYALEMQIGFFLQFFTIEIIWLRISFCIRIFRRKFCIRFKIPIGIIFRPKRWEWPIKFFGVGKQFRLARVKLLQIA